MVSQSDLDPINTPTKGFAIVSRLRGTGRALMGHEKYDLPLLLGLGPLPAPVPFWFRFGTPVVPAHPPEAADDNLLVNGNFEDGINGWQHRTQSSGLVKPMSDDGTTTEELTSAEVIYRMIDEFVDATERLDGMLAAAREKS